MKNGKTTSRSELYEVQSNADSESPKISTGKNYSSITFNPYARNEHLVNFTWFARHRDMYAIQKQHKHVQIHYSGS